MIDTDCRALLGKEDIINLCTNEVPMIEPFIDHKVNTKPFSNGDVKVISYGLSGAGYDIRIQSVYQTHKIVGMEAIDPKNSRTVEVSYLEPYYDENTETRYVILQPHECYKAVSVEYFRMPTDVLAVCCGKSTYARVDVIPHVTPLEPGWRGYLTIELSNPSSYPVRVYLNEGILQLLFLQVSSHTNYEGFYQNQNEQRPYLQTDPSAEATVLLEQPCKRDDGGCTIYQSGAGRVHHDSDGSI